MNNNGMVIKLNAIKKDIVSYQATLQDFDFGEFDNNLLESLIDVSNKISFYNNRRYTIKNSIETLQRQLSEKIVLNIDEIKTIFQESNIYFRDQIKKDYQDLVTFNKVMADDRNKLFKKQLAENQQELIKINANLEELNISRKKICDAMLQVDIFEKFKNVAHQMGVLRYEQGQLEAWLAGKGEGE